MLSLCVWCSPVFICASCSCLAFCLQLPDKHLLKAMILNDINDNKSQFLCVFIYSLSSLKQLRSVSELFTWLWTLYFVELWKFFFFVKEIIAFFPPTVFLFKWCPWAEHQFAGFGVPDQTEWLYLSSGAHLLCHLSHTQKIVTEKQYIYIYFFFSFFNWKMKKEKINNSSKSG